MKSVTRRASRVGAAVGTAIAVLAGTGIGPATSDAAAQNSGGDVTVLLVGDTWPELNPETNIVDALDDVINNAIFGGLFERTPKGIVPSLASGYTFSDGNKQLTIHLRPGVKFQDGTPMNAAAVTSEIKASLDPSNGCLCLNDFASVQSVTAQGTGNVVLKMSKPDPAIVAAFIGEAPNWPISTTALAKEGAKVFGQHPVGAGPFEVVSNAASSKLVLKKFPGYWEKGKPYLDGLTFESIGADQSALQALQSGSAQLVEGIATPSDIKQAQSNSRLQVRTGQGVTSTWVQMNRTKAPFIPLKARQALYYATDSAATLKAVQGGMGTVTESPSGPGGLFYEASEPGYPKYNLAKAKELVKQLGGLSFTLVALDVSPQNLQLAEALKSEWAQAGIKATIQQVAVPQYVELQRSHSYQAQITTGGGYNPSVGVDGLVSRVAGAFGGENDPVINNLIAQTLQDSSKSKLASVYHQVYARIASQAYGPYLYSAPAHVVALKSVTGIVPMSSQAMPLIDWENIGLKAEGA